MAVMVNGNPYSALATPSEEPSIALIPRYGRFALHRAGCPRVAEHAGDTPCPCIDFPESVGL